MPMNLIERVRNNSRFSYLLFIPLLLMFACKRPVVMIEQVPENTPAGARFFIAGNFNRWDPGDVRYTFEMDADSNYYYQLPGGFGQLEFKITRGEWSSAETDICGYDIENRKFDYSSGDTIKIDVLSWKDAEAINCPELTIVLQNIPDNTPEDEPIALAGNFNEWDPDSSSYLQRDAASGKYMLKIPRKGIDRLLEFKVTRGNLLTAEADKYGQEMEKRQVRFGMTDTLFIDVENWEDMTENIQDRVTIILDRIPKETPPDDAIFLTGSFNGWYPKDPKFRFRKNADGTYEQTLRRSDDVIEYKVSRGDWSTEEVDMLGYKMSNRRYAFGGEDTVHLSIAGWLDQTRVKQPTYTILVDKIPPTTPEGDDLYLAGSFNNWRAGQRKYRFSKNQKGEFYLTLNEAMRSIQYKVTRGDWNSQEVDTYGLEIPNRHFEYDGRDTVKIEIENWLDLPRFDQSSVVIVIDDVPQSTASDDRMYLAGNFNNWNPGSANYILNKNLKNEYYITIPRRSDKIEFKFTLGSWQYEELNEEGEVIPNRSYRFGYTDTLRLKVARWENR
jgi:hypothetical protein